jgi:hypothetical protein
MSSLCFRRVSSWSRVSETIDIVANLNQLTAFQRFKRRAGTFADLLSGAKMAFHRGILSLN